MTGLKCEVTAEQVYLNGIPEIPEGWEFVRFGMGVLAPEERFISSQGTVRDAKLHAEPDRLFVPSIIVRPKTL